MLLLELARVEMISSVLLEPPVLAAKILSDFVGIALPCPPFVAATAEVGVAEGFPASDANEEVSRRMRIPT